MSYKISNLQNQVVCAGPFRFDPYEVRTIPDNVLAKAGSKQLMLLEELQRNDSVKVVHVRDVHPQADVAISPEISTPFGQRLMRTGDGAEARTLLGIDAGGGGLDPGDPAGPLVVVVDDAGDIPEPPDANTFYVVKE